MEHLRNRKIIEPEKDTRERGENNMPYMGFAKLKSKLAKKKGIKTPGALAAWIGRKKYGKKKFQKAAAKHQKLKGK